LIPDLTSSGLRRLVVTSHPNHELAILGLVLRLRPTLLFLTDGGEEARIAETRRVLARFGRLENARFLALPESTLYAALVSGDYRALLTLAAEIGEEISRCGAEQVLCESMELYNPLHDLTLPLVAAALKTLPEVELVEFPLIAQTSEGSEAYRVQRLPEHRRSQGTVLSLDTGELAQKLEARSNGYPSLCQQLGAVILGLDERHLAEEVFAAARRDTCGHPVLPIPGRGQVLRYERRGEALRRRGDVSRVITLRDHFLPALDAVYDAVR
jgi:hypothetical protein